MPSTRYTPHGEDKPMETGNLLYLTTSVYGPDWLSLKHSHYFTEMFYITGGEGRFLIGEKTLQVTKGSIVIISPNVTHTELSDRQNPLEYIVLAVENARLALPDESADYVSLSDASGADNFLSLLRMMERELKDNGAYCQQACRRLLDLLLIKLMRAATFHLTLTPPRHLSKESGAVKQYIDLHFQESVTLDALAELSHLNKYYISHRFTQEYGVSPISYLLDRRIECAKQHLDGTDLSVSSIAQICGFSSQSYFSQAFKKATGVSPNRYKRQLSQPLP